MENNKIEEIVKTDNVAYVTFDENALCKMITLISMCRKEVAWHGTGFRVKSGNYHIKDIFLYPQKTTATNFVAVDYAKWQSDLILNGEEDKLDELCFHGHSHVNMGVSPSHVDLDFQEDTIKMTQPGQFYIFLIINKSFEYNFRIIDREDNVEYTTVFLQQLDPILNEVKKEYEENVIQVENEIIKERFISECREYNSQRNRFEVEDFEDDEIEYYNEGQYETGGNK